MKAQSPLLGFNNNVKHKGRVFHIQTEDSGTRHPHIITHLFADGGRILRTTKTSYTEHVGADSMVDTVRSMMKEQHKAMFIALRDGEFDHLFEDARDAAAKAAVHTPPGEAPAHPTAATVPARAPDPPVGRPPAPSRPDGMPPPRAAMGSSPDASNGRIAPAMRNVSPTAVTAPAMPPVMEVDVDLHTLERAAAEAAQSPAFSQIQDLPPPPAAVLGKKRSSDVPSSAGSYRTVTPGQSPLAPPPPPSPESGAEPRPKGAPTSAGRYAPTRPAAIFANTRPAEGASIFGEDLISEKSLDEVILSYLAEDLDSQPPKK